MGVLRSIESKPVASDVVIDLGAIASGASITFRQPKLSDYMPTEAKRREVQFAYTHFPPTLVQQVLLMGACYVRQPEDEPDLSPTKEIARLADSNMGAFLHILSRFSEAFPSDFGAEVADVKNESAG